MLATQTDFYLGSARATSLDSTMAREQEISSVMLSILKKLRDRFRYSTALAHKQKPYLLWWRSRWHLCRTRRGWCRRPLAWTFWRRLAWISCWICLGVSLASVAWAEISIWHCEEHNYKQYHLLTVGDWVGLDVELVWVSWKRERLSKAGLVNSKVGPNEIQYLLAYRWCRSTEI